MTPTIEEVIAVMQTARNSVTYYIREAPPAIYQLNVKELQAFAQHFMNKQREIDAVVADSFYHHIRQYTTDVPDIGGAIRNNTGE